MKTVALASALLFAASAGLGAVCALRCAGAPDRVSPQPNASHCGPMPRPASPAKSHPCGHGRRGEALVSPSTVSKVILAPAPFEGPASELLLPIVAIRSAATAFVSESPPLRSCLSVLRL
jgi:hypothetical protein